MSDSAVIKAVDLHKRYDNSTALNGLSLSVPAHSIFALLGRNGAGKTTFIKVLLDLVHADRGDARVFGLSTQGRDSGVEIRQRTAFVSEEKHLQDSMTVAEIIRFTRAFYPNWQQKTQQDFLRRFNVPLDRPIRHLSKGMRTQLALLLALSRGTELLILDEPTAGLDPAAAEVVLREIIRHVAEHGATVVFSSHQIAEVEQVADHVAIIDQGKAVEQGEIDTLRENYCQVQMVVDDSVGELPLRSCGIERVQRDGRVITVVSSTGSQDVMNEAKALGVTSIESRPMTLREIFLEKVGNNE